MTSKPQIALAFPALNTILTRIQKSVFLEYGLVLTVLGSIGILLFGRTLNLPPGNMLYGQDSHSFLYFVMDYLVKSIRSGVMPWWNPYWFSGVPMLSNPATGSIYYPGNILFFLFPISKAIVYFFLLHMVGAGVAMYWFCRKYMDMVSSLVAGIVLSYSGYMVGAVAMGHTESVAVMTLLPVIMGSLIRFLESESKTYLSRNRIGNIPKTREMPKQVQYDGTVLSFDRRKYFLLFVISLTLQILAGTYVAVLFTLEFIGLYYIFKVAMEWFPARNAKPILQSGGWIALGILLAFGISAVELLPFWQNTRESIRSEGIPFEVAARDSFNWNLWYILVRIIDTKVNIVLDPSKNIAAGSNINFEYLYFIGYGALAVILLGVVLEINRLIAVSSFPNMISSPRSRFGFLKTLNQVQHDGTSQSDRKILIFALLALVVFTVLAFGRNFFLYRVLYEIITPYQLIRRPIRHFFVVTFVLAYLAGWGIGRLKFPLLRILAGIAISIELLQFGKLFIRVIPEPYVLNSKGLVSYLNEHLGNSRLHLNFRNVGITGVLLYENASSYYHFPMISGYSPMILDRYYNFVRTASNAPGAALAKIFPLKLDSPAINYLSVKYVVDQKLKEEDRDDKQIPEYFNPVYEDEAEILYENPKALPRYFLVGSVGTAQNSEELLAVIAGRKINLADAALFTSGEAEMLVSAIKKLGGSTCTGQNSFGDIKIVQFTPNTIRLKVEANCPSVLVSSDPYYPGWEARIDGVRSQIFRVNTAFRSVLVPQGQHTVEFKYRPNVYIKGIGLSALSMIFLLLIVKMKLRKRS